MTQNEEDYMRYIDDLHDCLQCMDELMDLSDLMLDTHSPHYIRNGANINRIRNMASENLQPYFVGNHSLLSVKREILDDLDFLLIAVKNMRRICIHE